AGQRARRQQHFALDVNQRRRHVNKFRGHIHVQFFQLMQIIEVLRGDFRDSNVVDIHLLLFDQIQQQVQRPFVHGNLDFVGHLLRGRFHSFLLGFFRAAPRHLVSWRRHFRHSPLAACFPPPPISCRLFSQPNTASRTRAIVPCATFRALFEPSSRSSNTCFGFFSYFTRRSRTGVI